MRLQNRRVLVTGGGSGIGLETARTFLREGARVTVLDRSDGSLETARRELAGVVTVKADVSNANEVGEAVALAASEMGGIDGVANVAGNATRKSFEETLPEDLLFDVSVNLMGPFLVSKAALPFLRSAGGGSIVNVASGLALRPIDGRATYSASKGGLVVLSKAMAIELWKYSIRVNVLCPGLIETPLVTGANSSRGPAFSPEKVEKLIERRIIRRLGTPQEIANGMLYLMSEEASYVTGTVLAVDGGGAMH